MTCSAFTILAITLIAIILAKLITVIYRKQTYWKSRQVPYIWSVPILGVMWKFFFRRITILELSDEMYNSYPNARYVGFINAIFPAVLIRDPDLIRDVAVKYFDHFTDRYNFVNEEIEPMFGKSLALLRGERWKEVRNILSPSFTASKMRFMFELVSKCSQDFVDYLVEHPEYSSFIEAKDAFARYTNDVIFTVAFGIKVNSLKDRENEYFVRGKTIFNDIFGSIFKVLIINTCPAVAKMIGMKIVSPATTSLFRRTISDALKARREQGIVRPDMLHLLMQAKDKDSETELTVDDIVSQAFTFFLAGFDSSSTMMCFMVYELAFNPDIQEKLRNEVDQYFDETNGEINYETLSKMEYMDMVVSETNRKHTFSVFIDRVCTQEFELPPAEPGYNSVVIKPGDCVWFPAYALHHDPKYFPDPEKFDPERFNEENKGNILPYTYLPFGVGPRQCIGNRFALMEIKILMVHLLRKFVIKPNEKTPNPLVFKKANFALVLVDGWWFSLEKRKF